VRIGYKLCSEERTALQLVDDARRAEAAGLSFAAISDHFHPWIEAQGQSPFVWSVLGAVAEATTTLEVGTAVTCPTIRMHPAIVAQAAATVATLSQGRFFLGVGTGENLNEHVVGRGWPNVETRRRMLREAVDVLRALWEGGDVSIEGDFHVVDHARLYSLPPSPPPVYVAASGPASATLAGEVGNGLIATSPEADLVDRFFGAGGHGPRLAEILVCVGDDADAALRTVVETWPLPAIPGPLTAELPLPKHFEAAASSVREGDLRDSVTVGADPADYLTAIRRYAEAGFDHVILHQIGPDQERFFRFVEDELLPVVDRVLRVA
jgi:coenzyme F420-dependent glucose-6-phosphate dehydrogenase